MANSRKILVIDGHPDPDADHFCHALAQSYRRGAEAGGHLVDVVRVADLDFPFLRSPKDYDTAPVPASLEQVTQEMLAADHVVLIYPLWLGTLPALTKAFLEQVFHRDTAFEPAEEGKWPKGRLTGKSARVIVTMGMPALIYRFWYGGHSLKSLERNILKFIGFKPVRDTVFGMVEAVSEEKRKDWLRQVEDLGRQAI
ncbi:NAD(P)H-dependent oxidoreductase [uncultured Roseibium sp.]|uniref:NAD(P)H-dependent oxidoreductase n=1 Tax=uncultured Roseibium sp. TaxID=1936171 RepID=UPI003217329A